MLGQDPCVELMEVSMEGWWPLSPSHCIYALPPPSQDGPLTSDASYGWQGGGEREV
jgi:hypothetical protein